jgi:hypothetical protein
MRQELITIAVDHHECREALVYGNTVSINGEILTEQERAYALGVLYDQGFLDQTGLSGLLDHWEGLVEVAAGPAAA